MTFTDDFERADYTPEWVDDGPIPFADSSWVRAGSSLDSGAWIAAENSTEGVFNTAVGSIRHAADACDDQFIEAVVGNVFQGHDPSVGETFQWVEGEFFLFAQCTPGSNVCIGVDVIIHVASGGLAEGEGYMQIFTTDEFGAVTFVGPGGSYGPPLVPDWRTNPNWTIRLEATAAGHCKAYFEGVLLAEEDVTPPGGDHVGIGMEWNLTSYPIGDPPNPGVSFRVESVTGSLCAGGWHVGRLGSGSGSW